MGSENKTDGARNSAIDKTELELAGADRYANQGGGKLASGNVNSGHPANNVIVPERRHDHNDVDTKPAPDQQQSGGRDKGTKGSGMPTLSGAGQLADDRPGRDDPKS